MCDSVAAIAMGQRSDSSRFTLDGPVSTASHARAGCTLLLNAAGERDLALDPDTGSSGAGSLELLSSKSCR